MCRILILAFGGILLPRKMNILLWPDSEIAEQLGIKPDSMRMRYTRAKRKVAKALLVNTPQRMVHADR